MSRRAQSRDVWPSAALTSRSEEPHERAVQELTGKLKRLEGKHTEFVAYCARLLRSYEELARRLHTADLSSSESLVDLTELNNERAAVERELRALMNRSKPEKAPKWADAFTFAKEKVLEILAEPSLGEAKRQVGDVFIRLEAELAEQSPDAWRLKFKELEGEKQALEAEHRQQLQRRSLKWQAKCRGVQTELSRLVKENAQLQAHLEAHQTCSQVIHEQQQKLLRLNRQVEASKAPATLEGLLAAQNRKHSDRGSWSSAERRRSPVVLMSPSHGLSGTSRPPSTHRYRPDIDLQRRLDTAEAEKSKLEAALQVVLKRLEAASWHLSRLLKFCSEGFKYINREAKTNIDRERHELEAVLGKYSKNAQISPEVSPIASAQASNSQLSNEQCSFTKSIEGLERENQQLEQDLLDEKAAKALVEARMAKKLEEIEQLRAELQKALASSRAAERVKSLVQDCCELNAEKKTLQEQLRISEAEGAVLQDKFRTELLANERLSLQKAAAEHKVTELNAELKVAKQIVEDIRTADAAMRQYFEDEAAKLLSEHEQRCEGLLMTVNAKEQSLNTAKQDLGRALAKLIEATSIPRPDFGPDLKEELEYNKTLLAEAENWRKERETELLGTIELLEGELAYSKTELIERNHNDTAENWLVEKEVLQGRLEAADHALQEEALTVKTQLRQIEDLRGRLADSLDTEAALNQQLNAQHESFMKLQSDFNAQLEEAYARCDRLIEENQALHARDDEYLGVEAALKLRKQQVDRLTAEKNELLQRAEELDRLRDSLSTEEQSPVKIQALETQLAEVQGRLSEAQKECNDLKTDLTEALRLSKAQIDVIEATLAAEQERSKELTEMLQREVERSKVNEAEAEGKLEALACLDRQKDDTIMKLEGSIRQLESNYFSSSKDFQLICGKLNLSDMWERDLSAFLAKVQLDTETLDYLKSMLGQSGEATIEELRDAFTDLSSQMQRAETQLKFYQINLASSNEELGSVKAYNESLTDKYSQHNELLLASEQHKIDLEVQKNALVDQVEGLREHVAHLEVSLEQVKQTYALDVAELKEAVDEILDRNRSLQDENLELVERIDDLACQHQARLALLMTDFEQREGHWQGLFNTEVQMRKAQKEQDDFLLAQASGEISDLKSNFAAAQSKVMRYRTEKTALEGKLADLADKLTAKDAKEKQSSENFRNESSQLTAEREDLRQKLSDMHVRSNELLTAKQNEIDSLFLQIEDLKSAGQLPRDAKELKDDNEKMRRQLNESNKELLLGKAMVADSMKKAEDRQRALEEVISERDACGKLVEDLCGKLSSATDRLQVLGDR